MTHEVKEKGGREMTSVAVTLDSHHKQKMMLRRYLLSLDRSINRE